MKNYPIYLLITVLIFLPVSLAPSRPGLCASSDEKGLLDSLLGPKDRQPPHIELQDVPDMQTVYTEKVYIAGEASDENAIELLTVNKSSVLNGPGQSVFFSRLEKLDKGKNIITIEAIDTVGNRAKKEITVIREDLPLSQLPKEVIDKRMRIAVYPFEHNGTVSAQSGIFMDFLVLAFQGQNRFQLTDRAVMDRILQEQKLSLTKLIDKDAAVNIGRIMSAQAIIAGSIIETGSGTEMVGRMIDTETSEIIATENIHSGDRGAGALKFLAESLAVKFHNDFPMLRGVVIKMREGHIFTDLGGDAIPLRGRLIIYRENARKDAVLGYARITEVLPDMSKAELISGRLDEVKILDRVVLQ